MEKEIENIINYQFQNLGEKEDGKNIVQFPTLKRPKESQKIKNIFNLSEKAKETGLQIFPFIQEQKEQRELLSKIEEDKFELEVTKRLKKHEKEVFEKAHAEGLKIAKEELTNEFKRDVEEQLEGFSNILKNALEIKEDIYKNQKDQILFFIKSLTKWVILRELKDDGQYLEKLLEKLFTEIQTQQNFILQVSQKDFEKMPDIMKTLQEKLGEFKNSRVVIDYDLPENGVIIDSENGMIKSTLEGQFTVLDEMFGEVLPSNKKINDGTDKK